MCARSNFNYAIRERAMSADAGRSRSSVSLSMSKIHWPWSPAEDEQLRKLLVAGKGTDAAAHALQRTRKAVRTRAAKLQLSAKSIARLRSKRLTGS